MNFSQIKCFLAAADCLGFTRAAERLYLSQPVLSRQIAAMEEELGFDLFYRDKKAVSLTAAGEALAEGLTRLSEEYRALTEKAHALHMGYSGSLNIGMIEGQLICPPYSGALNRFRAKYPDVLVNLSRHTMASLNSALLGGEIDIGFAALFNLSNEEELAYIEVGHARTQLVIPKTHPLVGKPGLTLEDFKEDTFLTLPESESAYIAQSPERTARYTSFRPKTLEAPNIGALALWLEAGYGIFPLNENHSLRNNPNLVFIPMKDFPDSVEIVMWKRDSGNPTVPLFIAEFGPGRGDE